jgi:hypothetical protein
LRFEIFCRVVDNFGDAGVCWRVARQLAREHGFAVRLWIDRVETLAAFEPRAAAGAVVDGVRIAPWSTWPATMRAASSSPPSAARCPRPCAVAWPWPAKRARRCG